ncbi:MAG: hypothetical protein NZ926_01865 [Candidatus Methanomethylicia archaeon]|nr:hypothetical protein [Candidatus Methanomethylicia archaeon]MCX8169325.1 hypothetical protein [Candidatus Methanomethylicia archaeon]MDW7988892.1 hypothetical protein [Nitrososphaerota archaeon]
MCRSCQNRLESGEIDDIDIKISKVFIELESKFPELKYSTFYKAIEIDETVIVLVKGADKSFRTTWNKIALKIKDKIGKNVKIIEKTMSIRQLAEQILSPIKVKSVNTVWFPDGTCENYIKIPKVDLNKFWINKEVIEKVLSKFTKQIIRIVQE